MAATLSSSGFSPMKSVTATCTATLARAAVDGKLFWKPWMDTLEANAREEVTMSHWTQGIWWN
jgi:hypothetical protein